VHAPVGIIPSRFSADEIGSSLNENLFLNINGEIMYKKQFFLVIDLIDFYPNFLEYFVYTFFF
jgi:hypothetical protein